MAINVGTAIAYLELDTSKFSKGFASAYKDLKVFGDKSATVEQKLNGLSSAFRTTGSVLSKSVTLPLVGIGTVAVTTASTFEKGMSKVSAISGAVGNDLESLRNKAIEMGAKTKFSASEAADAFQYMAMAGWKTEDMLDGIEGIMNLAAASGEDLAVTSDIVTDALTAFGLSAKDSAHFADVLAVASSNSNTNVALMGETFKYVAPLAGTMGISIEDAAESIGLMANAGIKGSQAGTSFRSILNRIATDAGASSKSLGALGTVTEELGVQVYDSEGNLRDWSEIIDECRVAWNGLTVEQQSNYGKTIAGQEALSGWLALMNAAPEDINKMKVALSDADGTAKEMSETMMNNLSGSITILKSTLESAAITVGERLTPYVQKLTEWIQKLVEKFNSLSDEQKDLVVKIGLIVAAIAPLMLIFSKVFSIVSKTIIVFKMLVSVFSTIKTSILLVKAGYVGLATQMGGIASIVAKVAKVFSVVKTVLLAMNPVVLAVVAVIAALVGAFMYLWKTSDSFRQFWIDLWNALKQSVMNAWEGIQELFMVTLPEAFIKAKNSVISFVTSVIEFFTITIPTAFRNFVDVTVPNTIKGIIDAFSNLPYKIGYFIGQTIAKVYLFATEMGIKIVTSIKTSIQNIINYFKELPGKVYEQITETYEKVKLWAVDMENKAIETGSNFIQSIVTFFSQLPWMITTYIVNAYGKVKTWAVDMKNKAIETGQGFINSIITYFSQLPGKVKEYIENALKKITDKVSSFKQAGKDLFNALLGGMKNVASTIKSWVSGFVEGVKKLLSGIIDGFNDVISKSKEAKKAKDRVKGSHANGLSYVPFDGYVAELHEGERVLTKQENRDYNRGRSTGGDTFNFYDTVKTPYEYARALKKAKREMEEGF